MEGLVHLHCGSAEASLERKGQGSLWEAGGILRPQLVESAGPSALVSPRYICSFPCHPQTQPRAGRAGGSSASGTHV